MATLSCRRRKYQFADRAEAEMAYQEAERGRLRAEWLFTATMQGRTRSVGRSEGEIIGYFTTTHSAFVFMIHQTDSIHCLRGIWDSDSEQLTNVIAALLRYEDTHDTGRQLDCARQTAWRSLLTAAEGGAA